MGRKSKDNFGAAYESTITPQFVGPELAAARTGVNFIETMFYEVISTEVDSLAADSAKRKAYFSHLFDPVRGKRMREIIEQAFVQAPPKTVYGYPREGAEFPCYAIVLKEEHEAEGMLGNYLGETLDQEKGDPADYVGSIWEHVFGLLVYAENPMLCAGLYHVLKAIIVGADHVIETGGFIAPQFSGGELAPDQQYIPENIYVRVLEARGKSVFSVPEYGRDPGKYRVAVFADDTVVQGVRGGVHTFTPGDETESEG